MQASYVLTALMKTNWSELSDDEIRYQIAAFKRNNDTRGADYRALVAEAKSRKLRAKTDYRDAGEIRLGA